MSIIERAIGLAAEAHCGQVDKQRKPYIYHLLRVMFAVEENARVVAVLHDLLEDTIYTAHDLRSIQCSQEQIDAIRLLTRTRAPTPTGKEHYQDYIVRLSSNPIAVEVKIADLQDNLSRIDELCTKDQERLRPRYEAALAFLTTLR
jgi:(p)ppGpp synthase/HD superfamily hydrolase